MEAPAEVQSQLSSGATLYVDGLQASLEAADVMDVPEVSYHRESSHPPRISGSGTKGSTTLRLDDDDEEVSSWIGGDMPHTVGGQRQESPSDLNNSLRNIARIGVGVDPSSPINEAFAGKHSPSLQRPDVALAGDDGVAGVWVPSAKSSYATIAEAVENCAEGDVLKLRSGVYREERQVRINKANVRIEAEEGSKVEIVFKIPKTEAAVFVTAANVSLSGIHMARQGIVEGSEASESSSNKNRACIVIEDSNVSIENCLVKSQVGVGIFICGTSTPTITDCILTENVTAALVARGSSFTTCTGCSIKRNMGFGLWLMENADGDFNRNKINRNSKCGVLCCGKCKATFDSNKVSNGGQGGFWAQGETTVKITNNLISKNHRAAMQVSDDSNPTVAHNMILEGEGGGIVVHDRATGFFYRNDMSGSCRAGAGVMDFAAPRFFFNSMSKNNGGGAVVAGRSSPTFYGNELIGNGFVGLGMKENTTVILHHNTIVSTDGYGVLMQGASKLDLYDSRIENNEQSSVCVCDTSKLRIFGSSINTGENESVQKCGVTMHGNTTMHMEDCSVTGSLAGNILLNDHSSATILGCNIHSSKSSGVILQGSSTVFLSKNNITRNKMCNVLALDSSRLHAEWNTISEGIGCGVRIMGTSNVLLAFNSVMSNSEAGIVASGQAKLEMQLNRVSHNGKDGVYLEGLEGARLLDNAIFENHHSGLRLKNLTGVQARGNLVLASNEKSKGTSNQAMSLRGQIGGHILDNIVYMKSGSLSPGDGLLKILLNNSVITTVEQCTEVMDVVMSSLSHFEHKRVKMIVVKNPDGSVGMATAFNPPTEFPQGAPPGADALKAELAAGKKLTPVDAYNKRRASTGAFPAPDQAVSNQISTSTARRMSMTAGAVSQSVHL